MTDSTEILDQLEEFLASMRTAESLRAKPELLAQIDCPTPLSEALKDAIRARRHVVITGSAGGGKTHLLDRVKSELESEEGIEFHEYTSPCEPKTGDYVRFHPDGTKLSDAERSALLLDLPEQACVVIAINEGPLRELADQQDLFKSAKEFLRRGQLGSPPIPPGGEFVKAIDPVVIDVAGYNPTSDPRVVKRVLNNPLLLDLVVAKHGKGDARVTEWSLLSDPVVIERVTKILALAGLDGQPVLFRELWNLVGEMIRSDEGEPWYACLLPSPSGGGQKGADMRGRLSRYFSMSRVVLPGLDSYLWKGGGALTACDMKLRSEAPALHVDLLKRDEDEEDLQIRTRQFRLAQLRYLLCSEEEHPSLRHAMGDTPWTAREGEAAVLDVIKRLNRFRLYSSECAEIDSPSALNLLLNTELSHSRQKASGTQALLGQVSYKELKIVRSGAVLGLNGPVVDGSAYFLQGESTVQGELPPSLRLTGDLWKRLDRQRAVNRSDRESRELDIDLDRFFYSMVRPSEELKIVHTSVERMVSRVSGGRVLAGAIEWKSAERP